VPEPCKIYLAEILIEIEDQGATKYRIPVYGTDFLYMGLDIRTYSGKLKIASALIQILCI